LATPVLRKRAELAEAIHMGDTPLLETSMTPREMNPHLYPARQNATLACGWLTVQRMRREPVIQHGSKRVVGEIAERLHRHSQDQPQDVLLLEACVQKGLNSFRRRTALSVHQLGG